MRCQRMKMLRAISLISFILVCIDTSAQTRALPPWSALGEESTTVVVGDVLEEQLWVINPEKKAKAEVTPDGKPTLPNPSSFVVGILSRVRVTEVIKGTGKIKEGDTANVFIYGYFGSDRPHVLMKKEKCVLFLRPLDANNEQFAHATIVLPGTFAYPSRQPRFDPGACYTPVQEGYAQVILTPDTMMVADKIKQAIAKRP